MVGFGFTLIPPAISQGKQLIKATPGFLHDVRNSIFFQRLDLRFHLAEQLDHAIKQLPDLLEGAASPVLAALGAC
jgi:predicted PurR-regulated permease PerM